MGRKEKAVLQLVATDLTNPQIAAKVGCTLTYVHRIRVSWRMQNDEEFARLVRKRKAWAKRRAQFARESNVNPAPHHIARG